MAQLHFLFLQGGASSFFSRLANGLAARGCKATAINLCFGDQLFWRGPDRVNYRGRPTDWPGYIDRFLEEKGITDLVLLGEQRNYHREAVAAAKARGIRVTVTDFGYLRPDWITLEREGMGGNSLFPRNPDTIRELATSLPKARLEHQYTDSSFHMSLYDVIYSFSNVFLFWLYPHYRRADRRAHPFIYFPSIARRLLLADRNNRLAEQRFAQLKASGSPYFVFPLQLEHDFQIVAYSPFNDLEEPLQQMIRSFARHADNSARLLVKVHPWDPAFKNWRKLIDRWAEQAGVGGRVDYYDGGNLDEMIRGSAGMITVNSTSGLRALQLGCPVMTLGKAIFDVPGLTYQGELDTFWQQAVPPDETLMESFVDVMVATIQIRGVYYREPGLSAAVDAAVQRLYDNTVGEILEPGRD